MSEPKSETNEQSAETQGDEATKTEETKTEAPRKKTPLEMKREMQAQMRGGKATGERAQTGAEMVGQQGPSKPPQYQRKAG